MRTTVFFLVLSALMAYLTGCTAEIKQSGNGDPLKQCVAPALPDSKGGCSARWM